MTRIEAFANQYRLKVIRDECNDQIIQGRRGHLYFDGPELCLMVLDGSVSNVPRWKALGGNLWLGDMTPKPRVQDVKITVLDRARSLLPSRAPAQRLSVESSGEASPGEMAQPDDPDEV